MADYTILLAEVKVYVPTANDALVTEFIALLASVDACLEGAGVADATGKSLKRLAAAHMAQLTLNAGRGAVVSESVPAGARSFAQWRGKDGIGSTSFGAMLQTMDKTGCVVEMFESAGPHLFFGVVGT